MPIRIIVIEDHPLMLKAITDVFVNQPRIQVVGTATHGSELPRLVRELSPDVVILDLGMSTGKFEPITAVHSILQDYPHLRILVLTGYNEEIYIRKIVEAGALGYVLKNDDLSMALPKGVERVFEGKHFYSDEVSEILYSTSKSDDLLNQQELVVLKLAAQGLSNAGIAIEMNVSEKRVRNLLTTIYTKLELRDSETINVRIAAINKARELNLLPND